MRLSFRPAAVALTLLSTYALSPITTVAASDTGLYTGYYFSSGYTSTTFVVCGSIPGSEGCYGSGSLGPFGYVGALVEGVAYTVGDAVHRDTYVVDVAGGASGTAVVLYRYVITNKIKPPFDTVTYRLTEELVLPLVGGATVRCSLAANNGFLFIGTDQSTSVVRIAKKDLAVESFGGFSNATTVAAITADDRGFVIVAFGANANGPGGNIDFGPNGDSVGDGGGAWFTLSSKQGVSTKDLPTDYGSLPADSRLSVTQRLDTATPP